MDNSSKYKKQITSKGFTATIFWLSYEAMFCLFDYLKDLALQDN